MTTNSNPRNRLAETFDRHFSEEVAANDDSDDQDELFTNRLLTAGIDPCRYIVARPGTKRPLESWDIHAPGDVGRDSLIETGDGLLIVDIDDWDETPRSIRDLLMSTPTLTVQSPHASGGEGHYYFTVDRAPFGKSERAFEWGEVKYGSLVVTPGSEVHGLRGGQDCKHGCCSPDSPGQYTIREDRPIQSVTADALTEAIEGEPGPDVDPAPEPSTTTVRWDDGTPDDLAAVDLPDDYDGQTVTNEFGMTVEEVREVSTRIDRLCSDLNPGQAYPSTSEADWKLAQLLLYWAFDVEEVGRLLRYFRARPKIGRRDDYVAMTVERSNKHVTDMMDPALGWVLWDSCDEVGPAAGYDTLAAVSDLMADRQDWTPTSALTDETDLHYRRLLRGLHLLADAGRIERRGSSPLEWRCLDPGQFIPTPPTYSPSR